MSNSKRRLLGWMAAGIAAGQLAMPTTAVAQTTYNVASLADFTGPYADVMKNLVGGRWAVVAWWNEEVGKGLGVKINMKDFDHRYDAAQVASLWPGIKSELKPIAVLGVGGPDVAALQQRLPDDKIPMLMSTAGYGFAWRQDPWIFNPRPTYAHEAAAFYNWYRTKKGITGPLKVAIISSEASPAYVDIHKGANLYASENKDKVEIVETVFTEVQPSDLSTQVSRVVRKGAHILHIQTNTAAVVAAKRALQSIGRKDIPIMLSSHNGLPASGTAIGGLAQMEGDFEVYGMAIPGADVTEARKFFDMLTAKYKLTAKWDVTTLMGMNQALVAVRAIEGAVKDVGAGKLTGVAVRDSMLKNPISGKQTFGVLPDLVYTREAPFPLKGLTVNIGTVTGGKYVTAAENVAVPVLNKW
ncbi:MAG: ABC transporter substrate-binding protein [Piscinibacter sp.]|jgi:branched-chain amino acid transport system substrate-binding protein|nr:ABC transporter substrate-binding protein [Piscinibacter sp.]